MLLLMPLLMLLLTASARADRVPFRHYGIEDGLPHESVHVLAQTPDGQIWVGTSAGLAVYDGEAFETIALPDSVGHAAVSDLVAMPDGSVWARVGSYGVFQVKERRIVRSLPGSGRMAATDLLARGNMLFVFGLRHYWTLGSGDRTATRHDYGFPIEVEHEPAPRQGFGVVQATVAPDGELWVLDSRLGPGRLTPGEPVAFARGVPAATHNPRWMHLRVTGDDAILLTRGRTLYRYDRSRRRTRELARTGLITELDVRREEEREVAYVASLDGMLEVDVETGRVLKSIGKDDRLPSRGMRFFMFDPQGGMWVGTHDGLLHLYAPDISHLTEVGGTSLVSVRITDPMPADQLWMFTWGAGLVHLGTQTELTRPGGHGYWSEVSAYDGRKYALRPNELWQLGEAGQWRLLRRTGGAVRGYVGPEGREGFFWHDEGLHRLDLDGDDPPELLFPWTDRRIEYAHTLGPDGELLVRDGDRLRRGIRPSEPGAEWRFETVARLPGYGDARGRYLKLGPNGVAWIPFFDRGLLRVDLKEAGPAPVQVLPDRSVSRVTLVGDSLVLAQANDGLHVVRASDGTVLRHLTQRDGLLATGVSGAAVVGETLYLGHATGITKMPFARVLEPREAPPTLLTRIERRGERIHPRRDTLFAAGDRTAGFGFAPTASAEPGPLRYEYRLLPGEQEWTSTGRSFVRYTNLPPGQHRFEVRARYGDGAPGETASFAFAIPKYLHETWFFRLAALLVLSLAAAGLFRWRVHTLRRRKLTLEREVAARTSELRSEKRVTEEQARRLAELDEAKTRFFANISHEWRSMPMTRSVVSSTRSSTGDRRPGERRSVSKRAICLQACTLYVCGRRTTSGRTRWCW